MRLVAVALLLGVVAPDVALARAAQTLDIQQARVVIDGDQVAVDVSLAGLFSSRVRQSIEGGMPATLVLTLDLWRDRKGWFDQLVATRSVLYRMRYDAWREDYDLARGTEPVSHLDSLETVARALSVPIRVPVADRARLSPDHRYYVVVTASLRPLTPEGLSEIEQFLATQAREARGGPSGERRSSIARLPRSVLSVLAALSGLGDEMATYRTATEPAP